MMWVLVFTIVLCEVALCYFLGDWFAELKSHLDKRFEHLENFIKSERQSIENN